jgi:hypothetical protein
MGLGCPECAPCRAKDAIAKLGLGSFYRRSYGFAGLFDPIQEGVVLIGSNPGADLDATIRDIIAGYPQWSLSLVRKVPPNGAILRSRANARFRTPAPSAADVQAGWPGAQSAMERAEWTGPDTNAQDVTREMIAEIQGDAGLAFVDEVKKGGALGQFDPALLAVLTDTLTDTGTHRSIFGCEYDNYGFVKEAWWGRGCPSSPGRPNPIWDQPVELPGGGMWVSMPEIAPLGTSMSRYQYEHGIMPKGGLSTLKCAQEKSQWAADHPSISCIVAPCPQSAPFPGCSENAVATYVPSGPVELKPTPGLPMSEQPSAPVRFFLDHPVARIGLLALATYAGIRIVNEWTRTRRITSILRAN